MANSEVNFKVCFTHTHITNYRSFAFKDFDIKTTFYSSFISYTAHIAQFDNEVGYFKLINTDKMVKEWKLDD